MKHLSSNNQIPVWLLLSIIAFSFVFYAFQTGITGKTLKNGNGCECHGALPSPEVTVTINGPDTLQPGETAAYTVLITGGPLVRGGTNIAASNGILAPLSTDLRFEADELTHFEPKIPDGNAVTFQFNYTAPNDTGSETIFANGNSVNFNGENTGDNWNFALSKTISVVSPVSTFPLSVNVSDGWNMVSIPGFHPDNQNVTTWWVNKDPGAAVFKFASNYQSVSTVEPGQGYWMKHIGAQTYNTGEEWPAGILFAPHNSLSGSLGWNLIGGYEEVVPTSGITTTPPGLISGSIFAYQSGYVAASTLDPGKGYWVNLSGPGEIHIPEPSSDLPKEMNKIDIDNFGEIIITDNSGKSFILYAADDNVTLDKYELPPPPPQGIFDIRFTSQRYAEKISINSCAIEMTGVTQPVNIKAEKIGIIVSDETGVEMVRLKPGEEVSLHTPTNKILVSENHIAMEYSLGQNYPNPFNPVTTIQFSIPEDVQNLKLIIYNALGEKVAELVNAGLQAGTYNYTWNADDEASGIYIYQLVSEKFVSAKKMIMLK